MLFVDFYMNIINISSTKSSMINYVIFIDKDKWNIFLNWKMVYKLKDHEKYLWGVLTYRCMNHISRFNSILHLYDISYVIQNQHIYTSNGDRLTTKKTKWTNWDLIGCDWLKIKI